MTDSAENRNQPGTAAAEQGFLKLVAQIAVLSFLLLLMFYGICIQRAGHRFSSWARALDC
jgi:hypothetical protein